ncbi:hypothetical protein BLA60_03445 [Actinophytocola xinjiangensis]|uniref:Methylamine utilisation protein MauE domain-containing protein n=1 Tax=Actinophytocola xinjiangensis TaxID=485602 RepID=A0A7Z0WRV9_9PSEU|nr:MauE/DoxX family redox-associated membrane protein [Actinophytocola xinjiangensis]OLF14208.1 hypothetical protein BLA60_03445 [Actinophytocola xinjiangensis]
MQYWTIGVHSAVGVIFLVSSVSKVRNRAAFDSFVDSVRTMRLLGPAWSLPVAVAVVATEFLIWVLLAIPARLVSAAGLVLAAGLLLVLAGAIAVAVRRGVRAPCRCFGGSVSPLGPWQAVRNVVLASAALGAAMTGLTPGPTQPAGVAVAVVAGVVLGYLVAVSDDLIELFAGVDAPA